MDPQLLVPRLAHSAEMAETLAPTPPVPETRRRQGVVTAIDFTTASCSVKIGGQTDANAIPGVGFMAPYVPYVGDSVWLLQVGTDYLVLGSVGTGIVPWTPTLTASTTNPNLGASGSATGFYRTNGKMVEAWGSFLWAGAGVTAGSGNYRISVPFDVDVNYQDNDVPAGHAEWFDNGASLRKFGYLRLTTVSSVWIANIFHTVDSALTTDTQISDANAALGQASDELHFWMHFIR